MSNFADHNPSGFCQTDYCVVNDAVSWSFYRVALKREMYLLSLFYLMGVMSRLRAERQRHLHEAS